MPDTDGVAPSPRLRTLVALWSIPAAISALQSYGGFVARGEWPRNWPYVLLQLAIWWSWIPLTPVVFRLSRRWLPLDGERRASNLRRHIGAALGITIAHAVIVVWVSTVIQQRIEPGSLARITPAIIYATGVFARLLVGLLTYATVTAIAITQVTRARLRDEEVRAAQLTSQLASAQLGALRMQLQPHFLFNTLHAITVLIREDPPLAIRTVTRLGDLLRLTLSRADRHETTLARELELLGHYLEIERTRFHDRLDVEYRIDQATLHAAVPDLVLQPLVENAIRHAIAPHGDAGRLVISARREGRDTAADSLVMEVTDDGRGDCTAPAATGGTGIGLSTTRARLTALYGADHAGCTLVAAPTRGCTARIRLPFRVFDESMASEPPR